MTLNKWNWCSETKLKLRLNSESAVSSAPYDCIIVTPLLISPQSPAYRKVGANWCTVQTFDQRWSMESMLLNRHKQEHILCRSDFFLSVPSNFLSLMPWRQTPHTCRYRCFWSQWFHVSKLTEADWLHLFIVFCFQLYWNIHVPIPPPLITAVDIEYCMEQQTSN